MVEFLLEQSEKVDSIISISSTPEKKVAAAISVTLTKVTHRGQLVQCPIERKIWSYCSMVRNQCFWTTNKPNSFRVYYAIKIMCDFFTQLALILSFKECDARHRKNQMARQLKKKFQIAHVTMKRSQWNKKQSTIQNKINMSLKVNEK